MGWQFTATNSGSVTFTKTVTIDQPRITSGTLADTATITGDGRSVLDTASASVGITATASVSLQINKTIPAGSLRTGESVTFNFDISGPGGFSDDAAITFNFGDSPSKATTLTGLAPGTYTVHEVGPVELGGPYRPGRHDHPSRLFRQRVLQQQHAGAGPEHPQDRGRRDGHRR